MGIGLRVHEHSPHARERSGNLFEGFHFFGDATGTPVDESPMSSGMSHFRSVTFWRGPSKLPVGKPPDIGDVETNPDASF